MPEELVEGIEGEDLARVLATPGNPWELAARRGAGGAIMPVFHFQGYPHGVNEPDSRMEERTDWPWPPPEAIRVPEGNFRLTGHSPLDFVETDTERLGAIYQYDADAVVVAGHAANPTP